MKLTGSHQESVPVIPKSMCCEPVVGTPVRILRKAPAPVRYAKIHD
jgi:hypothetical protein